MTQLKEPAASVGIYAILKRREGGGDYNKYQSQKREKKIEIEVEVIFFSFR